MGGSFPIEKSTKYYAIEKLARKHITALDQLPKKISASLDDMWTSFLTLKLLQFHNLFNNYLGSYSVALCQT